MISGVIVDGASTFGIEKAGVGTLTLSGNNTNGSRHHPGRDPGVDTRPTSTPTRVTSPSTTAPP
ncbi:MAG: hypothetical protein U1G05_10390 [Kiritimatiellia bacterium]